MERMAGFAKLYFPVFLLGAVFGKLIADAIAPVTWWDEAARAAEVTRALARVHAADPSWEGGSASDSVDDAPEPAVA